VGAQGRDDGCRFVTITYGRAATTQSQGCGARPVATGPVEGRPDYSWATMSGQRGVVRASGNGAYVFVTADDEAATVALAGRLHPVRALTVIPGEDDPAPDTESLLARAVRQSGATNMVERGRIEVTDGFVSVWAGETPCTNCDPHIIREFLVGRDGDRSYVTDLGGGGIGACLSSSGSGGTGRHLYVVAVTADPAWHLQRLDGTTWLDVGTATGVMVEDRGIDGPYAPRTFRAVDATGTVVCTQ
jgi:hypothetical protein